MKTPGTRPAIGAAEDRLVAEIALDATEFASHQVECFIPRHFNEGLGAAALREGAGTMLEPALAHGGTADAQALDFVDAPMGQGERALMSHGTVSLAGDGKIASLRGQNLLSRREPPRRRATLVAACANTPSQSQPRARRVTSRARARTSRWDSCPRTHRAGSLSR